MSSESDQTTFQPIPALDVGTQLAPHRAEVHEAIGRVLDSGIYVLGPEVEAFEKEFATFCTAEHCVGLNSGTSALHLAMRLFDIGVGDEVIIPPYTFASTAWAPSYVGAKPVFVEIDEATFNLDPAAVEAAITDKTKAIIAVHLYGHPADTEALSEICQKHNLALIEDAAQAHGAELNGKRAGVLGDVACFSFYPTKNLPACGEGGALVTNRADLAERCRALRNHGSFQRYFHEEVGYNYRMEAIQGAALRIHLKSLQSWNDARRKIAHRYLELLADTPLLLPREAPGALSAYHLFTIRTTEAEGLKEHLKANQIGYSAHYPKPMHLQPCYAELGHKEGDFPVSEAAAKTCINLPIFPTMTDGQIERVGKTVSGFFS
ncbi:DegT/DnrJ/EryC1/StrS family aminotransferase [Rubellicoccus peritrichatus]|uniref:DegT/DnrJ/EryC1/StrS family aminotransferase n=1 Tax=Rubellicoccus peritrichatus TaxID=3080537 RepID=A0AAQ3L5V6_9BACT|nr:DegT/DnrJ/EryC1/StrS family aminotransferase [Puniceicoccus sp. CR14]WOO40019.1 DegT/DnrJ/EryC1/StrS family aminotransferase [Puniceicoccus sp. CR14]